MPETHVQDSSTLLFVTGATGFLGSHFIYHALKAGARVEALVRADSDAHARERIGAALAAAAAAYCEAFDLEQALARVEVLRGDICQAGCGVDLTVRPVGRGVPTSAWHFAASLSFEARQRSMIFEHNFGGTCNVLDLAVTLGVRRFIHVHRVVFGGGGERDGEARDQVSHVLGEIDPSLVHLASMPFRSPVALHRYALLLREFFAESASGPPPSNTAPTLVMPGAADEVAHPAAAAAIGAAIPHASSLVLPDGDHYSMYFDPSIAQTIHDFIAAALERGGPAEITARSAAS